MTADEYKSLLNFRNSPRMVHVSEVVDPERERTLLYGYTGVSDTFHLYLKDGRLHLYIYRNHYGHSPDEVRIAQSFEEISIDDLPRGHIYPAASDFGFCNLVLERGHALSITSFDGRPPAAFYGKLIGQAV